MYGQYGLIGLIIVNIICLVINCWTNKWCMDKCGSRKNINYSKVSIKYIDDTESMTDEKDLL